MKCDNCKYALWKRTANDRLHPNKTGRCTYVKDVRLPASGCLLDYGSAVDSDRYVSIKGGYIERGKELITKCAYYAPIKGGE